MALNLPTARSQIPEMPTTWPRSLMAVAAPTESPGTEGSASIWSRSGPQTTGRNCRTCGGTQLGSRIVVSVHPTTWRRLLEPVANPLLPPSVGSARIVLPSHTTPRQVLPVREGKNALQLHLSPRGSTSFVSAIPESRPRSFFTGQMMPLLGPPSVPRSKLEPRSQRVACWVASPGRFDVPDAQPRSFRLLPELTVPPSDGRLTTTYAVRSFSEARVGPPAVPASTTAAIRNRAFTPFIDVSFGFEVDSSCYGTSAANRFAVRFFR